ncbi:MAG: hypothetical protein IJ207_12475 [Treponema sp.]|uniref:hypothetical protein n=1 Tax=Treponema sp. TaxID=166 RepID=UPI0025F2BD2A|nr:hypothetical protein [Treponema sp.]MBQ9282986.1 hypothetical protein [Treponema sp.]
MKKVISVILLVTTTSFCLFPADKYEKIASETCKAVTGAPLNSTASSSEEKTGLTTGEKVAVGAVALGAAALLGAALLSKDKYEKIADKAYEASKSE